MNLSKRSLLGVALAGIFVFAASAASADVFVFGDVMKTKTKVVTENIYIQKNIYLTVWETIDVDAVAEQEIIKNQRNEYNWVVDEDAVSTAEILDDSGAAANGVVLINQSPGFENNQGNEVSITYAVSPFGDGVFSHAQVAIEQRNEFNNYIGLELSLGSLNSDTIGREGSTETGPFDGGSGIVDINQAAGHMNNQNNAQAIALGDSTVFALGEIDLGQWNSWNAVNVEDQLRSDTIAGGAFANFDGIVKVNQSAGSMNNQANLLDIAADVTVTANPFGVQ
jgi:hypothetical protein